MRRTFTNKHLNELSLSCSAMVSLPENMYTTNSVYKYSAKYMWLYAVHFEMPVIVVEQTILMTSLKRSLKQQFVFYELSGHLEYKNHTSKVQVRDQPSGWSVWSQSFSFKTGTGLTQRFDMRSVLFTLLVLSLHQNLKSSVNASEVTCGASCLPSLRDLNVCRFGDEFF